MTVPSRAAVKKVATNRKAFRDYFVLERFEAGIELRGTEVKALREGLVNLTGGYAQVDAGEAILTDVNISPYEFGNRFNHDPARPRRLLLHKKEINRLFGQMSQKGHTLIPLSIYFVKGHAKVELGLCKGKQEFDKRETLRRKAADLDARRTVAGRR
jgi:SsrA-binding protein